MAENGIQAKKREEVKQKFQISSVKTISYAVRRPESILSVPRVYSYDQYPLHIIKSRWQKILMVETHYSVINIHFLDISKSNCR